MAALSWLVAGIAVAAAATAPPSNCPSGLKEVSLLNSGASYCITGDPCSGNYRSDKVPTKTACPAEGQVSSKGDRLIIKPTCCAIINNATNVLGCVFEAAKYTCIAPSPAPIPTSQPLPAHNPNAAEVTLPTPVPTSSVPATTVPTTTPNATVVANTTIGVNSSAVAGTEVSVGTGTSVMDLTSAPLTTSEPLTASPSAVAILPVTASVATKAPLDGAFRKWNIEEDNLAAIVTDVPGRVFVSSWNRWLSLSAENRKPKYEYITAVVQISASSGGNATASQALIDMFTLVVDNSTIFVSFNASQKTLEGDVLVEIYLRSPVARIAMQGSAEAFLEAGVVLAGADVALSTTDGDLYVDLANVTNVSSLAVTANGIGSVQLLGKSLVRADSVALQTIGDGSIVAFLGTATVTEFSSHAVTRGDVHVYSQSLNISSLSSTVEGSGGIAFASGRGTCGSELVVISGVGNVETARILCVKAMIKIDYSGRGDAIVQASEQITTDVRGPGNVLYFNTTPAKYPAYKKHFYETHELEAQKLNESAVAWPSEHTPQSFQITVTEGGSWLSTVSVEDLDHIILMGCLFFLLLILLYILYRCYKRYKEDHSHGEYQPLQ
ncbi:hypothetical protein ACHHYP_01417 [Achlya hypogyna]|uniref:Putative auto-transporter adhesin head GIN domain-containing protein n=1 Tax=Achlya hypogyna TaxID=1202772 RepID=A0A1V9Z8P2_ACHHY|nr:hypothetical protein ACHHYP_01417 [Achlya hypogyna]